MGCGASDDHTAYYIDYIIEMQAVTEVVLSHTVYD